jgi:inorganic pyrophosphatase
MAEVERGVPVIVEIPEGSRNKYEFDHRTPIGLLPTTDDQGRDLKLLTVPLTDPTVGFAYATAWMVLAVAATVLLRHREPRVAR